MVQLISEVIPVNQKHHSIKANCFETLELRPESIWIYNFNWDSGATGLIYKMVPPKLSFFKMPSNLINKFSRFPSFGTEDQEIRGVPVKIFTLYNENVIIPAPTLLLANGRLGSLRKTLEWPRPPTPLFLVSSLLPV